MPGRMRRVFCVLFALNVISGCSAGQLFVPLEGSAWVSGSDGVRQSVRPGQIACVEVGEMHSKGSEGGLTALMVQVRAFAFEDLRPGA